MTPSADLSIAKTHYGASDTIHVEFRSGWRIASDCRRLPILIEVRTGGNDGFRCEALCRGCRLVGRRGAAAGAGWLDAGGPRPANAGRRPFRGRTSAELLPDRRRGRQHPGADRTGRGRRRRLRHHRGRRPSDRRDSPADPAPHPLHHQHRDGCRSRRRQPEACPCRPEHPAGRGGGRSRSRRRAVEQCRRRERAGTRERADADVGADGRGGAFPIGAVAHQDLRRTGCTRCT